MFYSFSISNTFYISIFRIIYIKFTRIFKYLVDFFKLKLLSYFIFLEPNLLFKIYLALNNSILLKIDFIVNKNKKALQDFHFFLDIARLFASILHILSSNKQKKLQLFLNSTLYSKLNTKKIKLLIVHNINIVYKKEETYYVKSFI